MSSVFSRRQVLLGVGGLLTGGGLAVTASAAQGQNPVTLATLFDEHVAASLDKQLLLRDRLGQGATWAFSMQRGTLTFNNSLSLAAQILGTESEVSNTWLWAWANTGSNIPARLLRAATQVRSLGQKSKISELVTAQLPLSDRVNGGYFSLIASGVYQADAFYRGPYENGAVFLLIKDPKLKRSVSDPVQRIALVFPQVIATYPVQSHRTAFTRYLAYYRLKVSQTRTQIVGQTGKGQRVVATFDASGRLIDLQAG